MNQSKPASDSYSNLLENIRKRRQSWREAVLQVTIESFWFWIFIGSMAFLAWDFR